MPVAVVGGSGLIGRAAVAAFANRAPQVRAYVRRPEMVEPVRALGANVAVGDVFDVDTLATVLQDAHTVCHLVGGANLPSDAVLQRQNLESVRASLEASGRAGVRRFLLVSAVGADPASPHPYLRAKGEAERAVSASGLEYAIVRCTHVYGVGGAWFAAVVAGATRRPALVIGVGDQQIAPVFAEDVAAVLAAADDRRDAVHGSWTLEGPDRVTADGLCDLLAGAAVEKIHLGADRAGEVSTLLDSPISSDALRLFAGSSVADRDLPSAAEDFRVRRTPLRQGLARTLERAAAGLER